MTEPRTSWSNGFASVTALWAMFICASAFAYPDSLSRHQPGAIEARSKQESSLARVERLGNEFFKPGTAQQIQLAALDLMRKQDLINTLLVMQAEHNFALVERNVDAYLDWYYSLSGEYMRIYKMVTGGQLDDYMREKLVEHLQMGKPFSGFERSMQEAESQNAILLREHKVTVQRILDINRINPEATKVLIVQHSLLEKISNPAMHFDFEALRKRLLVSGVGGALTGSMSSMVTGKVMEKVDSQNILEMATKTLAKFVTGKVTGSLGGASVGAAVGSAIPGIGTAIGAVVGIVIGSVVIDKGIQKLDELMNRETFKDGIMAAIAEAKRELVEAMRPEPSLFFQKH